MNVTFGAKTDPGKRANNEDALSVMDVQARGLRADGVLIIADGMGGRNFGERASTASVETVEATLAELLSRPDAAIADALDSALRKANAHVYDLSRGETETQGMGTTCVAAVIAQNSLFVAHAGDSRAYRLRDGNLERLTDDHSYVAEQVKAGVITEEGARTSRFRNVITRAVGIEPTIEPEVSEFDVLPGDSILLCTDGLTNVVDENVIAQTLAYAPTAQAAADKLVQLAVKGGGRDNITAIVAALAEGVSSAPREISPKSPTYSSRRSLAVPILTVLLLLSLAALGWLGWIASRAGFHFSSNFPFLAKLAPPPAPKPPDLSGVTYAAPVTLLPNPVRGDLLAYSSEDGGSVSVVTLASSTVVRLDSTGKTLFKYPLPRLAPPASAPAPPRLHLATDAQGNVYFADSLMKSLRKFRPNGEFLRTIGAGKLTRPESLAVGADGTVFVIDAERLNIIRAQ